MLAQESVVEVQEKGFCLLKEHFVKSLIEACREDFQPIMAAYLHKYVHQIT